jgi:hypothetical protein
MRKGFYLPRKESKLAEWLKNFSFKLKNEYASTFGIISTDADNIVAYAAFYSFLINYLDELRAFSKGLTKYKDIFKKSPLNTPLSSVPQFSIPVIPATLPSEAAMLITISNTVNAIKAHPSYAPGIGKDLGIEGTAHDFNPDQYMPKGKAKAMPGSVKINYVKKGVEAMNIYGNPVGSTNPDEWVLLATHSQSPYHDARALEVAGTPESRRYRLRGVIADKEIGKWSDVMTVAFAG